MAREGVLEALFSHQFSDVERKVTVNRVLKNVPERKVNLEFITALFNNVLDNSKPFFPKSGSDYFNSLKKNQIIKRLGKL